MTIMKCNNKTALPVHPRGQSSIMTKSDFFPKRGGGRRLRSGCNSGGRCCGLVLMKMRTDQLAGCEAGGSRSRSCTLRRPGDKCPATLPRGGGSFSHSATRLLSRWKCRDLRLDPWPHEYSRGPPTRRGPPLHSGRSRWPCYYVGKLSANDEEGGRGTQRVLMRLMH